jgi:hypothetical protein
MQASDWQFGNERGVDIEPTEVCGEHDFQPNFGEFCVGTGVLLIISRSSIQNQDGLVDLNPLSTSLLQLVEQLSIDWKKFRKEVDGIEVGRGILGGLAENEERYGTEDNGPSGDTGLFSFLELVNVLAGIELELDSVVELGNDIVVIRVEPRGC